MEILELLDNNNKTNHKILNKNQDFQPGVCNSRSQEAKENFGL